MKVLIVDDDAMSRLMLARLLDKLGVYDVPEAEDGEQAWNLLQAGLRPSLIFCDARMPHLSGAELLERIRGRLAAPIPFIFVSASDDQETLTQAAALGALDYLVKPYGGDDLRNMLNRHFPHQREQVAEAPAASARRLNIGLAQLLGYLSAFQTRLEAAMAELPDLAGHDPAGLEPRLAALEHACLTLGLNHAGQVLAAARTLDRVGLMASLSVAHKGVLHQIRLVNAQLAASPV